MFLDKVVVNLRLVGKKITYSRTGILGTHGENFYTFLFVISIFFE